MQDNRNVTDEFKGVNITDIIERLDERGVELQIAVENTLRDYNMGTIVRTANAFGVRHIHVIGRRQWNKRGAMATDKYLHVHYHASVDEFAEKMIGKTLVAIENNVDSISLLQAKLLRNTVLIFGQEGPGISPELLEKAAQVVHIEQLGSTRSLNVASAAAVAMYTWLQQNTL